MGHTWHWLRFLGPKYPGCLRLFLTRARDQQLSGCANPCAKRCMSVRCACAGWAPDPAYKIRQSGINQRPLLILQDLQP